MGVVDINFFLHLFSLSTAYDTLTSILLPTIAFCRPKPITPASARERTPVPLRRWRGDFRSEIDRANFLRAKALYLRVSFFFFSSSRCVTFACPKGWMCKKWEGLKRPGRFPEAALRFRPSSAELGLGECESLGSKCSQNGYSLSLGLNAASTIAANQRSGFSHLFKGCADYFLLFISNYYLFLLIIIYFFLLLFLRLSFLHLNSWQLPTRCIVVHTSLPSSLPLLLWQDWVIVTVSLLEAQLATATGHWSRDTRLSCGRSHVRSRRVLSTLHATDRNCYGVIIWLILHSAILMTNTLIWHFISHIH